MLLGRIAMTENGIELFDVDGSSVKFNAQDAIYIKQWLTLHEARVVEVLRRQEKPPHLNMEVK